MLISSSKADYMRAWLNYSLRKLFGVNCEGSLIDYSCELANDPPKERVNLRSPHVWWPIMRLVLTAFTPCI